MRKILDQKFWSHGTPLGFMGPLSPKAQSRATKFLGFLHDFIPILKNFKDFWMVKTPIPISMYINCEVLSRLNIGFQNDKPGY